MKVRVIQIITKLELGGAQEITLFTVKNLPREKYDVTLITGEKGLLTREAEAIPDIDFIEVNKLVRKISLVKDLTAFFKIRKIIKNYVINSPGRLVVHTHSSKAGIIGRFAAYFAGADRIVHSIHGYGFNDFQSPLKRMFLVGLEKAASFVTDGFTADSHDNVRKGDRYSFFKKSKVEVIRSGISVDFFAPGKLNDKPDMGVPHGSQVVTMISCLKPQKAPLDFVKVAELVLKKVPAAHFVLVGDGELRGPVLEEAEKAGISLNFHLLGWRRDVREIIHSSDVMVLTSLWEGLPRVVLMAMAAGKPVVATAVDGTPEAVRDGVNGFLARPHDIGRMSDNVALLLKDEAMRKEMGERGRETAGEFDEGRMLSQITDLYDRLLKGVV